MRVIIVGAGPTGLTAGIELARQGVQVEIIDKKKAGSTLSRAVGINPHSLKILEASGVTESLLKEGIQYNGADFYRAAKPWATIKLTAASPVRYGYNFMLGLPQDRTEAILSDVFIKLGGKLHYDTTLQHFTQSEHHVELKTTAGATLEGDYLIGADGTHSLTRELLGIAYEGFELPETWSIADIEARDLNARVDGVSLYFVGQGAIVFMAPIGQQRFRLVSNTRSARECVPFEFDLVQIHREGEFKIKVAQVKTYQKGRVFLAGDAAHAHSPAGGRGMNLGIADAADLAEKLLNGQEAAYTKSRYKEGKRIIAGSEQLRKLLTTPHPIKHILALCVLKLVTAIPFLQKKLASKFLYG